MAVQSRTVKADESWFASATAAVEQTSRPVAEATVVAQPRVRSETASRVLNVGLALFALIALSPLMLVLTILVILGSTVTFYFAKTQFKRFGRCLLRRSLCCIRSVFL